MRYVLTGVDRNGKRFRKVSDNYFYLKAHNVWRGSLWAWPESTGVRSLLYRWTN